MVLKRSRAIGIVDADVAQRRSCAPVPPVALAAQRLMPARFDQVGCDDTLRHAPLSPAAVEWPLDRTVLLTEP